MSKHNWISIVIPVVIKLIKELENGNGNFGFGG